ncbi:MAG: futalosine hydrolase [Thermodesulfobacteriota bacterium]|nr:futalosine hydrolase [Thermodesulfobacteriota bacterium]
MGEEPAILILSATRMEISPLLKNVEVTSETVSAAGRRIISAKHGKREFKLVITGPGTINCAQALTGALEHQKPDIVLQTGIAGIFKETGLKLGDIGIADSEKYIHTGIENPRSSLALDPLPFDLIKENILTRKGIFPVNRELADQAYAILSEHFSKKKCQVIKGPFITVSAITSTQKKADKLFSLFSPCMEAMEGSAAAHVTALYKTDFLEIRAGSNYVGKRDKNRWDIPFAAKRVCQATALFLEQYRKLSYKSEYLPFS